MTEETAQLDRQVTWIDWSIVALAIFSICLLGFEMFYPVTDEQRRWIIITDISICGIFLIEFIWRWSKDPKPKTFALRNWYEVLGMIPVSHPALRAFRLFRVVRIIVLLGRLGKATDRVYGEGHSWSLVTQFKAIIAEFFTDVISLQILDRVGKVLHKGEYSQNIARIVTARSDEITEMVVDNISRDEKLGLIRRAPFFDSTVRISAKVTQQILLDILNDPRTDKLIADMLSENLNQIRDAIAKNEALGEFREPDSAQNRQSVSNTHA